MNKQLLILPIAFVLLFFIGCGTSKEYTDYCAPLRTDNITKITFEIRSDTINSYAITSKGEMEDFITDINNSTVNGPWKGAKWDRIILQYDDGEIIFNTNGEVFGQGSSGMFYNLNDKYSHYWKK